MRGRWYVMADGCFFAVAEASSPAPALALACCCCLPHSQHHNPTPCLVLRKGMLPDCSAVVHDQLVAGARAALRVLLPLLLTALLLDPLLLLRRTWRRACRLPSFASVIILSTYVRTTLAFTCKQQK